MMESMKGDPTMQDAVLTMTNVSKSYKKNQVLSHIGMTVPRGAIYGLVGSNGAGKSTLMRIIAGQTTADEGELTLFGTVPQKNDTQIRHRMGTLIEEPGFFRHMTAEENLEYYRLQFGVPGRERIAELLHLVGLDQVGKKKFKNFSNYNKTPAELF